MNRVYGQTSYFLVYFLTCFQNLINGGTRPTKAPEVR
jgi:hypothetical protein